MKGENTIDTARRSTIEIPHSLAGQAARAFDGLAALALGGVVVLLPLRASVTLLARSLPSLYPGYTDLVVYPADYLVVATLALWGFSLLCRPRPLRYQPLWLTLPLLGLTLAAGASAFSSADRVFSIYQSVRLALLFGLFLYALNEVRSLGLIFLWAAVGAAAQAAVAVEQALRQHSLGLTRLHELVLDPSQSGISVVVNGTVRTLRAYGLTDHPNILGGCLAIALILLLIWHLQIAPPWRVLTGGVIILSALGLFLTFSRSAWLGLAGGLILIAAWLARRRDGERLTQLMVLASACLLVLAPFIWQDAAALGVRLGANGSFTGATVENQSINERILLARQAIGLFAAHPLTGVGVGTFPQVMRQANPNYAFGLQPPHQVALDLAAETGVFGGIFYLVLEIAPWAALVAARRRLRFSLELIGISAALLAISVISLLDYYPWMFSPGQLWQWLLWGLWGSFFIAARKDVGE
jgi:hypothetical protein